MISRPASVSVVTTHIRAFGSIRTIHVTGGNMQPNRSKPIAPRVATAKWWLRVTYKIGNLDGWNACFLENVPQQRAAGIDVFKVTWKRRKSLHGRFAWKVTVHARVNDRVIAEKFMAEPEWLKLAGSKGVDMELTTISNAWHPLRD